MGAKKFAYYNENDPFAAEWLRKLIRHRKIADGEVDERSIVGVGSADLQGFQQCRFFAGIGAWSYVLRKVGLGDDQEIWTGSCPCQPFSGAGKRGGAKDERHLWPQFFRLIRERRPRAIFGEQVASKDGLAWLDAVSADLEGAGYAVGAVDTCAAGFGAPHIRQRLYFVAEPAGLGRRGRRDGDSRGGLGQVQAARRGGPGKANGFWKGAQWILCSDRRARPVEPGAFPLVNGFASRVGRLRAYGNAICAPQALEFVKAYKDSRR